MTTAWRDISVSIGGRELIEDSSVALSFGRHYGLVGRNGTGGKQLSSGYLVMHAFEGIPKNCQTWHVEQEVVGVSKSALQCVVINSNIERSQLLEEEARLVVLQRGLEFESAMENSNEKLSEAIDKDALSQKLELIYKRLEFDDLRLPF